jgi:hypothetical protein
MDFKVAPSGNLDKKHFETTYFPSRYEVSEK